jgi:eukaryotic-like serine/threonine-protein kinase
LTAECLHRASRDNEQPADRIEVLNTECRYLAARCAALAGCGLGKDAADLSAVERTRWRKQARDWLRADLAAWTETLDSDAPMARDLAKKMLTLWQTDPDLAGIRELIALDKFSPGERQECVSLWNAVSAALIRSENSR